MTVALRTDSASTQQAAVMLLAIAADETRRRILAGCPGGGPGAGTSASPDGASHRGYLQWLRSAEELRLSPLCRKCLEASYNSESDAALALADAARRLDYQLDVSVAQNRGIEVPVSEGG